MKKLILLKLLLLTSLLTHTFAHADFDLAAKYYAEQNFEKAYQEFFEAARYGDHDSQHNLGAMYYRGEYVTKDIPIAYAWMALAAQADLYHEEGTHKKILERMPDSEKEKAKQEYEKLYAQYSDSAIEQKLTPTFTGKTLSVKDYRPIKQVAPTYPQSMLKQGVSGFVDAVFTVDKYGVTRDHVIPYAVSKSFEKAAIDALRQFQFEPTRINNIPVAVNGLRMRFNFEMQGQSYNKKKLDKVIEEQREKASHGDSKTKLGFAYFLEAVPSFAKDYQLKDNPNKWYIAAANEGSGAASYFLGRNILYGNMCSQNNEQSMGWLLKAAKAGVADAQYMLALESFSGARFEKNEDKGFYWLNRAAGISKAAAIRHAWILATHPEETQRNGKLAAQYMDKFDNNYADKQSLYQTQAATAAENGDFKQAIKWQKKALDDAKELNLPLQILEQQLTNYSAKKPWREEI